MESSNMKPVLKIEGDNLVYAYNHNFYPDLNRFRQQTQVVTMDEYNIMCSSFTPGTLPIQKVIGGTMLKSPYDDKYYPIQDYENAVMHDKVNHIAEIARNLGVVYYRCVIQVSSMQSRDISVKSNGSVKDVKLDANWQQNEVSKLKSGFEMEQEFPQAAIPTVDKYQEAVLYAQAHHLDNDSGTQTLLNSRKPDNNNNYLGRKKISIKLSTDLNTNLDVAANLTERSDIFNFSIDYCKAVQIKKDISLDVYYYFAIPGKDNQEIIDMAKRDALAYLQ